MKILITGAHFTPAVATIEQLKKYPDVKVVYVGRKNTQEGDSSPSAESQELPGLGIKYIPIITGRLQRSFTFYTIPSLLKIPIGIIQATYIVLREKPDLILSFGGYVAVPTVFIGWLLSIKIIVHEQTLVSGLANKISGFFADKIALSFNQVNRFDQTKTIITGNPIRSLIKNLKKDRLTKGKFPQVLITGGNQGSHIINKTVEESLDELTKITSVIHVTGDNKFKDFERLKEKGDYQGRYLVKKWIGSEYGLVLQKVDLVVSRAGINTLSELAYLSKPALVIPFEPLYQDEQNKNAKFFQKYGLVKIIPQSKLSGKSLLENIKFMLKNLTNLEQKARNAETIIKPDAAKRLALECISLLTERN